MGMHAIEATRRIRPANKFTGINQASPQARGLFAWWGDQQARRMDTGQALTLISGTVTTRGSHEAGAYLYSDGTNGAGPYLSFPATMPNDREFSASMWLMANGVGNYRTPLSAGPFALGFGFLCSGSAGNPLTFRWNNVSGEYDAATGLTFTLGQWYLAVASHRNTNTTIYLVGGPEGWRTSTLTVTDSAKSPSVWYVGTDESSTSGRFWNGGMADPRLYSRALTEADVRGMFHPLSRWDLYAQPQRVYAPIYSKARFAPANHLIGGAL